MVIMTMTHHNDDSDDNGRLIGDDNGENDDPSL